MSTMARSLKQWKEAATLVIAARKPLTDGVPTMPGQKPCDYQLLMLQRQRKSSAFANNHVFPGGVIDPSDFSTKWVDVFRHVGVTSTKDFRLPDLSGKPRPWPVAVERGDGSIPNDAAFRICSVRETFEESGVLLLTDQAKASSPDSANVASCFHGDMNKDDLRDWQKRVHQDGSTFMDLCSELKAVPDIWSLKEWYHVLTPQIMKKRYDTMFYTCAMDSIPDVVIDNVEMVHTEWGSPDEILRQFTEGKISLGPPQIIQAAILLKFPALKELNRFTSQREFLGLESSMPYIYKCRDGLLDTQEGDDLYPSEPTYDYLASIPELDETIEETKLWCKNLFRIKLRSNDDFFLDCNVELPCGLPSPMSLKQGE